MSYNHEPFAATIIFGKPVTRKTIDVSNRVFTQKSLKRVK